MTATKHDESDFVLLNEDYRHRTEPVFEVVAVRTRSGYVDRVVLRTGRGRIANCFHGRPLTAAIGHGDVVCRACEFEGPALRD